MKIFELKTLDESDWIVARTVIEALKVYERETGNGLSDFDNEDEIVEVPESEWDRLMVSFPDDADEPDQTFRQMVEGATEAFYGWTTCY